MSHSDRGFITHTVCLYFTDWKMTQTYPGVLNPALASELMEMLQPVFPEAELSIIKFGNLSEELPEARRVAALITRHVIAARGTEHPGRAFLQSIGYWLEPNADQSANTSKLRA